ncbi:pollen receptor-like kinase 4 [Punica granatum]|uniref:Protein kinase domain-containing protein n=2 Tax=Punica granatum TaxID=22663 RepID=A0A218W1T6_PUNGR|nr:pollen receptor-like kinase 4 [Punica granatum]OWM66797.1 hypothetical protein CDL15_Pgr012389 [Punica granatum]PKI55028.1 hypothetical protein CRG98_024574 [Punica granatum]
MACSRLNDWAFLMACLTICFPVVWSNLDESQVLIKFKNSLSDAESALSGWTESTDPCSWVGVRCMKGNVSVLQLESMGLTGTIDMDSLSDLCSLRSLSVVNNSFDGLLPDIKKLVNLKNLYLARNQFSGKISDDAFEGMLTLKVVYLGQNQFTDEIPKSLVKLPRLVNLSLEDNQFKGRIPEFHQMELQMVNVANNQFVGPIPKSLSKMSPSFFAGNKGLCGKPLNACKSNKKLVIMIAIAVILVVALGALIGVYYLKRSKANQAPSKSTFRSSCNDRTLAGVVEGEGEERVVAAKRDNHGKLCFVRTDRAGRFELQKLLRASAELLRSGSFGSSYKAVLQGGPAMVVRRFRHMNNVGKEEFYQHMRRLGALSHPNLLPLVAFYYRKDEKLLLSDFIPNGSLASHLHANRSPTQPGLDWPTRVKIIKGVCKGLSYLYKELSNLTLPHGHLKSSNVLLDHQFNPILSDYALVPVVNKDHAHQCLVAYKSPEFEQRDRTTRKTDVWSLGILILELLTGKFPANYLRQEKVRGNADLATWVSSVVREEWTGEVFDKDMRGTRNREGEMLKLLKIAMCCCEWNPERRWDLREAAEKIAALKERDPDEDFSSYASDDFHSSRAMTDDDFSFSVNHG